MNFTRESIFTSATRSFCNTFAVIIGIGLGLTMIAIGIGALSSSIAPTIHSEIIIAPNAEGSRSLLSENTPVVLKLQIQGVVGQSDLTTEAFTNKLLDSQGDVIHQGRVKAILLYVNTPGGTVVDADGIYQQLLSYKEKYKVPVYAFVDGMCASGGMYICSAADKIYASSPSVIGSVGVILGPTFNFADAMDKVGIKSLTIKQGKDKDALNPFRPWTPGEDASLVNITQALYNNFVEIVIQGRPQLNKEKLINEYGAQVYLAKQAKDYGYIDVADSNYKQALSDLVVAAGLNPNDPYQVFQLSSPTSILSNFINGKSPIITGKLEHSLELGSTISSELSGKLLYLYNP